ncbi:DUF4255 domain-containing protein [Marinoscillum sp.]|uniref:DUF4255 domain-containing protein n=1 Tax=Marinoscillum sp. TaxID=2024838 RepID=UPI003BA8DF13
MIYESLKYIADSLDNHLRNKYRTDESWVQLNSILGQDGSVPEENRNKIILTLVSLEHESATQSSSAGRRTLNSFSPYAPPLSFNLNIIFSALFNKYDEGLKFLSDTICFFQSKPIINPQNSPGLDPKIHQLGLEVVKLSYSETYNLWASIGAKYIPSIPFKLRMLCFQGEEIESIVPTINQQGVEVHRV